MFVLRFWWSQERHQKYFWANRWTVDDDDDDDDDNNNNNNNNKHFMLMLERGSFMIDIILQDSSWCSLCS
jgi:hypothetical protein